MNQLSPQSSHQDLQQILHLLEMAESQDNRTQTEVFLALRKVEEQPLSYYYLTFIFNNPQIAINLRKMAGLMMNSALRRNSSTLFFEAGLLSSIKKMVLEEQNVELQKIKCMMASNLIRIHSFDYQLFNLLIEHLPSHPENIMLINFIIEDLKYNNENYNEFQQKEFIGCIQTIYRQLLGMFSHIQKEELSANIYVPHLMKCMNLLTFHCPPQLYPLLQQYLLSVVKTVLELSQQEQINVKVIVLALEGLNQIIATKSSLMTSQLSFLIVNYNNFLGNSQDIEKNWVNIMIEIVDNDEEGSFSIVLPAILPRVIQGLIFTEQDERNLKEEMALQYNPYVESNAQNNQELDPDEEKQEQKYSLSGYTLRKLCFMLIDKISVHYYQHLWNNWNQYVLIRMKSQSPAEVETAVAFVAAISETCIDTMTDSIEQLVTFFLSTALSSTSYLLRTTCIWGLQKLLPSYQKNQSVVFECIKISQNKDFHQLTHHKDVPLMMYQEACISLLDQIIENQTTRTYLQGERSLLQQIVKTLAEGLNLVKGRALISIFKAISTVFEHNFLTEILTNDLFTYLVNALNEKWKNNQEKDSVVCPIIECLITGSQSKKQYFQPFIVIYFQTILPLLGRQDRGALVLRCIDFMSSLINNSENELTPFILGEECLERVYSLLYFEDKSVKHFSYGLISDIGKKYNIQKYLEKFIQGVAQTIDSGVLTSMSNGLTCLTDLIVCYPFVSAKYVSDLMQRVVLILKKERLESIFALNFARLFGRLSLLNPELSKQVLLKEPKLIKSVFLSLRTREVAKITSDCFRGLLHALALMTQEELLALADDMECVVDALICYPIRFESSPENDQLLTMFKQFVKHLHQQMGVQKWIRMTQLPLFLPGTLKTLTQWLQ